MPQKYSHLYSVRLLGLRLAGYFEYSQKGTDIF